MLSCGSHSVRWVCKPVRRWPPLTNIAQWQAHQSLHLICTAHLSGRRLPPGLALRVYCLLPTTSSGPGVSFLLCRSLPAQLSTGSQVLLTVPRGPLLLSLRPLSQPSTSRLASSSVDGSLRHWKQSDTGPFCPFTSMASPCRRRPVMAPLLPVTLGLSIGDSQ